MCFLSSFPGQDYWSSPDYYLAFCGMALNGLGGYGMALTTEISDAWFDESSRLVVNSLFASCLVLGESLNGLVTPNVVTDGSRLYIINMGCLVLSLSGLLVSIAKASIGKGLPRGIGSPLLTQESKFHIHVDE